VHAALEVARELGPDKHVVTILCDTGERYFSLGEYFQDAATKVVPTDGKTS
jgi:cysteine synthase A